MPQSEKVDGGDSVVYLWTICQTKNFKFWTRHLCTLGNFCRALLRKNQEPRDSETKRLRSKETRVKEFKSARNSMLFLLFFVFFHFLFLIFYFYSLRPPAPCGQRGRRPKNSGFGGAKTKVPLWKINVSTVIISCILHPRESAQIVDLLTFS